MKKRQNKEREPADGPFNAQFRAACKDAVYLYERGYPAGQITPLTGDRYRLNSLQRSVLRRGLSAPSAASKRKAKLVRPAEVAGRRLSIDGCNVLALVGNYLNGFFVYIAGDGLVRDAAESAGVFRDDERRRRAVRLAADALSGLSPGVIDFYIDAPLPHSRDLARELQAELEAANLSFEVKPVTSADKVLKAASGILVSGDSEIADSVDHVFDLSRYIIEQNFKIKLPDLGDIIKC